MMGETNIAVPGKFAGKHYIAGVELGGTKCICALVDADRTIIDIAHVPTTDPATTLGAIETILADWWQLHGFAALGIASFGPVDLDPKSRTYGFITSTSKPGWPQTDVAGRLGAPFGVPVAFDTDVNGAATAEGLWGAAQGLDDFAYMTVGTGVGVGLVVHGKPTRGLAHCELGHVRVARLAGDDWPGMCPYHGDCVEGLVSGPAIKARIQGDHVSDIAIDDPLWDSVVHGLAQLCQVMVLATGPRRIIIGGGVIGGQPHLLPRIEQALIKSLNGYAAIPLAEATGTGYICAPGLGSNAGPLGPIALAYGLVATAD